MSDVHLWIYNAIADFDGHVSMSLQLKVQVRFCCHDWTSFIVVCVLVASVRRLVENNIPGITTWRDLALGNTEFGGIPELFPCILKASDGAKWGISTSPGVGKNPAKAHDALTAGSSRRARPHRGLFSLIRSNWNQHTAERITKTKACSDNGGWLYMATCPAALSGQITQLTDLSRLVFRVTITKSHLGYCQRKTRARFVFFL